MFYGSKKVAKGEKSIWVYRILTLPLVSEQVPDYVLGGFQYKKTAYRLEMAKFDCLARLLLIFPAEVNFVCRIWKL